MLNLAKRFQLLEVAAQRRNRDARQLLLQLGNPREARLLQALYNSLLALIRDHIGTLSKPLCFTLVHFFSKSVTHVQNSGRHLLR